MGHIVTNKVIENLQNGFVDKVVSEAEDETEWNYQPKIWENSSISNGQIFGGQLYQASY